MTKSGTVIKVDVGSVGMPDMNLQRDGIHVREQLNPTQLEALKFGNPLGELLKFWLKRMGQK